MDKYHLGENNLIVIITKLIEMDRAVNSVLFLAGMTSWLVIGCRRQFY